MNILLSSRMMGRELDEDFILLGGPISNVASERFLQALAKRGTAIEFDANLMRATVPNFQCVDFDLERVGSNPGVPRKDLGLIIVASNPWEGARRGILCCGFSTFGTAAAASYLFSKLSGKQTEYWTELGIDPRRSDGFGMLVEACFDGEGHAFEYEPIVAFEISSARPTLVAPTERDTHSVRERA